MRAQRVVLLRLGGAAGHHALHGGRVRQLARLPGLAGRHLDPGPALEELRVVVQLALQLPNLLLVVAQDGLLGLLLWMGMGMGQGNVSSHSLVYVHIRTASYHVDHHVPRNGVAGIHAAVLLLDLHVRLHGGQEERRVRQVQLPEDGVQLEVAQRVLAVEGLEAVLWLGWQRG